MAALRLRSDGRHEVADTLDANRVHGCQVDDWCILANDHEGRCSENREVWAGPDIEYAEALVKGSLYVGTTTGMLNGVRVYRDVDFIASRDQEPEAFVRGRVTTPDQDRVFVVHPHGSVPALYVAGSIRPLHRDGQVA